MYGNRYFLAVLFALFVFAFPGISYADTKNPYGKYRFLESRVHAGSHLYTGELLKTELASGYRSFEVRYGWQSCNPDSWQSAYLYPSYGIGWYMGFIGDSETLGRPGGLYGFIAFPLVSFQRHTLVLEPALGLTYGLNPYNSESNPDNDAIGSRYNVYFSLHLGGRFRLNAEVDLTYGFDFTHFSNGSMYKPNSGLNMFGPNVGVRYNFQAPLLRRGGYDENIRSRPRLESYRKAYRVREGSFLLYAGTGIIQIEQNRGSNRHHSTFSAFLEYQYRFTESSAVAAGVDVFVDNSQSVTRPGQRRDFYGAHLGYDFMFWKLNLRMQAGTYLHERGWNYKGNFFLRPALKMDVSNSFFVQIGLKTRAGFVADWVEFGIGVNI